MPVTLCEPCSILGIVHTVFNPTKQQLSDLQWSCQIDNFFYGTLEIISCIYSRCQFPWLCNLSRYGAIRGLSLSEDIVMLGLLCVSYNRISLLTIHVSQMAGRRCGIIGCKILVVLGLLQENFKENAVYDIYCQKTEKKESIIGKTCAIIVVLSIKNKPRDILPFLKFLTFHRHEFSICHYN